MTVISKYIFSSIRIIVAEVPRHIPELEFLNETATMGNPTLRTILAAGFGVYALVTFVSCHVAIKRFERVDM